MTIPFIRQLSQLEPFGKGNTKPVFAQKNLQISQCRVLGKNRNVVKMQLKDEFGAAAEGIWFGDGDVFVTKTQEKPCFDVIYYPTVNSFRGRESIEMVVQSIR